MKKPLWFARWLKFKLIKSLNIDIHEAEYDVNDYPSFGAFFSRRLKTGARPIDKEGLVSPCDGKLQSYETITSDSLLQSKGVHYSLNDLLGDGQAVDKYQGGLALTIYLAPHNYHRVHTPDELNILRTKRISGDLWPVNRSSVEKIHPLFCLNERWIAEAKVQEKGCLSLVMVGATNVGKMEVFHLNEEQNQDSSCDIQHDKAVHLHKGQEFGVFHMGSTVILILDRNLSDHYKMELCCSEIRCGEKLTR